jgi:hypothetical protein
MANRTRMQITTRGKPETGSAPGQRESSPHGLRDAGIGSPHRGLISRASDVLALQGMVGNRAVRNLVGAPVQRLVDGFYKDGSRVQKSLIKLTPAFKKKHVAETEQRAQQITQARIAEGKPTAMVNGKLGNTTAKEEDWISAIDTSNDVIPDQDAWKGGLGVKVTGWDARLAPPSTIGLTPLADAERTIGGYMKKQGGAVEIDHVSGQND